jgi:hypothetical protein
VKWFDSVKWFNSVGWSTPHPPFRNPKVTPRGSFLSLSRDGFEIRDGFTIRDGKEDPVGFQTPKNRGVKDSGKGLRPVANQL